MTDASDHRRSGDRFEAFLVVFLAAALLIGAAILTPAADGYGTHRSMLVVPCIFRTITHIPCPFCGLTTAYAHMARLQIGPAFGAHVLGPLAYLFTWAAGLWGLYALAARSRVIPAWMSSKRGTTIFLLIVAAGWLVNIIRSLLA